MTARREVIEVNKNLDQLLKYFNKKERKKIVNAGAAILVKEARSNIQDSKEVHHRYSTDKLDKSIKAPKGSGKITASYYPGNLIRSIRRLNFRRSSAAYVGPKINKGSSSGVFGRGNRVDGWYAHFQEFGTANNPRPRNFGFMRKSLNNSRAKVIAKIEDRAKKQLEKFKRNHTK